MTSRPILILLPLTLSFAACSRVDDDVISRGGVDAAAGSGGADVASPTAPDVATTPAPDVPSGAAPDVAASSPETAISGADTSAAASDTSRAVATDTANGGCDPASPQRSWSCVHSCIDDDIDRAVCVGEQWSCEGGKTLQECSGSCQGGDPSSGATTCVCDPSRRNRPAAPPSGWVCSANGIWPENAESFVATAGLGFGPAPSSACAAPSTYTYVRGVGGKPSTLSWDACATRTATTRSQGSRELTLAESRRIEGAAVLVTPTTNAPCGADKGELRVRVTAGGQTRTYVDDFYRCSQEAGVTYVANIGDLFSDLTAAAK